MPVTSIRAVEHGQPASLPTTWRARERNGDSSPADSNLGWKNNGHLSTGNHCHAAIVHPGRRNWRNERKNVVGWRSFIQAAETGETRKKYGSRFSRFSCP